MTRITIMHHDDSVTESIVSDGFAAALAGHGFEVRQTIAEEDVNRMPIAQFLRKRARLIAALRDSEIR
jgi:hypothetical protein